MEKRLKIAVLGCGSRGRAYSKIIAKFGDRYTLTAAADHNEARRRPVAELDPTGGIRCFDSSESFFAAGKLADVLIIATQDAQHFEHAMQAIELGYDLLLEKPAAESLERCEQLNRRAKDLGRRIALCFVLRYTPFYSSVKHLIDSGKLGKVISMRTHEGVEPFHQAHSFVRGHWRSAEGSTPMIVSKCSHDADLLCWLGGASVESIASYGDLSWFRKENAPTGATERCADGCPAAGKCIYDAHLYLKEKRNWLAMVMDGGDEADDPAVMKFLKTSPWGRCVYRCDNDVVDHQVLSCRLKNGVTATHTMTAFDYGRSIEIYGTLASLKGGAAYSAAGAPELWLRHHSTGEIEPVEIELANTEGYAGHGGGDYGLISSLYGMFRGDSPLEPGLDGLAGHRLSYLAEKSRVEGRAILQSETQTRPSALSHRVSVSSPH